MNVSCATSGSSDATLDRMQPKPNPKTGPGSRASLACLSCRSRHIRCDARKPTCQRCAAESKTCVYAKSRRGGLDRAALAALAARQRALPRESRNQDQILGHNQHSPQHRLQVQVQNHNQVPLRPGLGGASGTSPLCESVESGASMIRHSHTRTTTRMLSSPNTRASQDATPEHLLLTTSTSPLPIDLHSMDIVGDAFIGRYYKYFHRCHPCVLPRRHLERLVQSSPRSAVLGALISVLKYMGSLYFSSARKPTSGDSLSQQLDDLASAAISEAVSAFSTSSSSSSIWLLAQSHFVFSIGQYWQANSAASSHHLDAAIRLVTEYRMYSREFASEHGQGDPVIRECLRRTWWQIYIVDASHAAIQRRNTFALMSIQPTADLPCEEEEYHSGEVPQPKTLQQFDAREFAPDDVQFSSFAYLIGAVRTMATAISRSHAITSATSQCVPSARSPKFLGEVDALIRGWMLLVPESKSHVFTRDGEVDELLFYAYMALHATSAGLHRSFSECHVNPLEALSSCSSPHVRQTQARWFDLSELSSFTRIHTARCVEAAEAQIRMLSLPALASAHSPFTICMLTTGTLSLLAACKFILGGEKLSVARDQIRASIGYHRAMANVWAQGKTNLHEIQEIARTVLAIDPTQSDAQEEIPMQTPDRSIAICSDQQADAAAANDGGLSLTAVEEVQFSMDDPRIWSTSDVQIPMDIACWWTSEPEILNS